MDHPQVDDSYDPLDLISDDDLRSCDKHNLRMIITRTRTNRDCSDLISGSKTSIPALSPAMFSSLSSFCYLSSSSLLLSLSILLLLISSCSSSTKLKFNDNDSDLKMAADSTARNDQLELLFTVAENVPVGTFIGVIRSPNDTVQIEPPFLIVPIPGGDVLMPKAAIASLSTNDHLQSSGSVDIDLNIDQSTGEIRTAVELDREQRLYYSFIAISLTGVNVHVRINIEDVNDNAPRFPTNEIELEFPENSKPRDVKRTLPPAIDRDRAIFGTQTYRIVSGNVANAFRLISHREKDDVLYLDLQVNGLLDRETIANYNLIIEALDGGQPPLKDRLWVKINILDHNDCEPVFSQSHYYGSVSENVTLGTSLLKVTATDNDEGDNGQVIYILHSRQSNDRNPFASGPPSSSSYFAINRHTGWIYVIKPLDYESQDVHELIVIARDQGVQPLETSAFVSIRVTDVNDNQPTVNILFLTANSKPEIREDAQIGDLVARVSVNDADMHATSHSSSFIKKSSSKRYSPYNGLSVSLFGASDGEFGLRTADQIAYLIVVTGKLDREKRSKYQLTVVVSDKGQPPQNATTVFDLEVTDVNDNAPYFDQPVYHTTLPEAIDIGTSVFRMQALDPDSDSMLTYAFLVPNDSLTHIDDEMIYFNEFNQHNHTHQMTTKTRWFSIDHRSGLITTRALIDCETEPEPKVIVIVSDSLITSTSSNDKDQQHRNSTSIIGFTSTATLIISISDINDNEPIFDQSFYNISIPEDTPVGHCLLQLTATDADCGVNAMVNYSLELSSPMMLIGGSTRSPRAAFHSVKEHAQPLNSNHQHQHDQLKLLDHFNLNPETGQLCLQKPLDFEMVSVYNLPVLATDRGGLSTTAMIKIHVIDTNDNAPIFYPREYKVSVGENAVSFGQKLSHHPLVIVAATDQDSPRSLFGQIEYEIKTGNEKNYFDIDRQTGEIFLLKPLSAVPGTSSHTQYKLTVMARDGGGLESKDAAFVLISVIPSLSDSNRNQATPVFLQRQFNFQIIENVAQGAIVGTVRAKIESSDNQSSSNDEDYPQSEPISYAIYSGDPDGYFTIDPRHGILSVKSSNIDREKHSYLLVNVQAYAGHYPGPYRYAHTQVNITILDENDNVPMFPSPTLKISVPENIPVDNGTVFVAHAIDYDAEQFGRVQYSLYPATSHDSDDRERFPFVIEDRTGHVRLRKSLDYETRNEYQIRVVAIDGGQLSSEMLVHIFVQDVNDNAPIFIGTAQSIDVNKHSVGTGASALIANQRQSLPLYKIQVPENVAINTHIYQVKATDADNGNNARLTYSLWPTLQQQTDDLPIDIFPNNGVLYVRDGFDRENVDHYELLVFVTDHGLPKPLNATAVIQVTIQDINDNRPYWKQTRYIFDVVEDSAIGTFIGQVSAFDIDLGDNSALIYGIINSPLFDINRSTGQIYLKDTLDRETKDRYEFFVDVHDQGVPQSLYSEEKAIVIVNVLDVNDNRPVFDEDDENNRLVVPIGTSRKSTIATFRAYDQDAGENGTVYYGLTEENDLFTIDRVTGALIAKVDIKETLKRAQRKISLIATDGQGKKSKIKVVDVEIVDKRSLNIDLEYVEQYNFNLKSKDIVYGYRIGSVDLAAKMIQHHQCNNRFFTNFNYQIKNNLPFFVENDDANVQKLHILTFKNLDQKINDYNLLLCIDWSQCLASVLEINDIKSHHHQMIQCDHFVKLNVQIEQSEQHCRPLPIENRDLFEVKIPFNPKEESSKNNDLLYLNNTDCPSKELIHYEFSSPMMNDETLNRMFSIDANSILQMLPYDKTLINQYLHEDFVLNLIAKKQNQIIQSVPIRVKIISSDTQVGNIAFMNEKFIELDEDCCHVGSPIIQARINISHDDFKIKYFLASYGESHLMNNDEQFMINTESGLLTLKREFDYERKHEHRINITAVVYDSKKPIATVSNIVKIRILNTNDEPPVFVRRSYEKEISEDSPVGQLIVRLEAKDSDQQMIQSNITYLLPKSYRYASYFDLNSKNGELKLAKTLDRETIEHFYVPVYAFDDDFRHHTFTLVNIKVLDVNDNLPYFVQTNFDFKIPESVLPGTIIYTLVAIDPDLSNSQTNSSSKFALQYRISSGNVGNKFVLNEQHGELSVNAPLDREIQSIYHLIVEVSDSFHYSSCNVTIELLDVNDNAPMFDKSDYYAILNDGAFGWLNVVTVRAIDSDGDKLLYRIENDTNNMSRYLNMNSETGEITLHSSLLIPLFDRLGSNVFTFEVSAIEAGKITYHSYVSKAKVHVTFIQNEQSNVYDVFKLSKYPYVIIVDESRHSLHVNQKIGFIELTSQQNYLNANKPDKSKHSFSYRVLKGGESYRSFNDYFTIQQQTGAIVVKRPLNYNYYEAIIEVTQKFDPKQPRSTTSLIQIFIGGIDDRKFVQSIQLESLEVAENQPIGTEIVNLGSFIHRSSSPLGYNYLILYADIDRSYFEIQDGRLRLKETLDYESQPNKIQVLAFAYQPSVANLHEHSYLYNLTIHVANVDDNLAQFTQKHYIATIREGEQTGTFVAQVNAIDIDDESLIFNKTITDRRYSYYIVDGNDDNAFSIDNIGAVRTNIVLDREIRDRYQLKIIATEMKQDLFNDFLSDEASYQHLTQCIVEVIIIDQNDNVPVFPPYKEISVSEDAPVGSVIATWTANDVDIHPMLTYTKLKTTNNDDDDDDEHCFDIGLYTGKIYLKCPLKPLSTGSGSLVRKVKLLLQASDQMHTVETDIIVNIKQNYSRMTPLFGDGGNFYEKLNLDDGFSLLMYEINVELFRVPMIEDPIVKRKITYSLNPEAGKDGFYIDQSRGIVYNNQTIRFNSDRFVMLTVFARYHDSNIENQASLILNFVRSSQNSNGGSYYYSSNKKDHSFGGYPNSYNLEIESSQIGVPLLRFPKRSYANYLIVGGNTNKNFIILRGKELVLVSRPLTDQYLLKIKPSDHSKRTNSTIIFVHVKVRPSTSKDSTTFASPFKSQIFELEINENEKIGTEIQNLKTETSSRTSTSMDNGDSFHFRIFSGNELNSFRVDSRTGVLIVDQKLDYETNPTYRLGIVAESYRSGSRYFTIININLINVNEYCPQFPSNHFKTLIDENVSLGAKVIPIKAIDQDQDELNYTVIKLNEWNDSLFRYDPQSGYLITDGKLDYEAKTSSVYKFIVRALDASNHYSNSIDFQCNSVETIVEVQIGSVDEHSPQFVNDSYNFKVVTSITRSRIKVGQVLAIDSDLGPDGQVIYSIKNISPQTLAELVHINSTTGVISMSVFSANLPKQLSMIVSASSGRMNSLNSLTVVNVRITLIGDDNSEIDLAEVINTIDQGLSVEPAPRDTPLPGWIIFLIILLILITFILMVSVIVIRMHQQQQQEQQHFLSGHLRTLAGNPNVGSLFRKIGPSFVESGDANDPNISPAYSVAHYGTTSVPPAPPCYNDVTITTNVCQAQPEGHSTSSGRGSAEDDADLDDVDEEIRMINESSNHYTDDPSEQVTTIAEYLARLGVTNHYEEEPENTSSVAVDDDDDESIDMFNQSINKAVIGKTSRGQYGTGKKLRTSRGPSVISMITNTSAPILTNRASIAPGEPSLPSLQPTVHNEEELSGSYNWDYLQHWGPKYQPLSSVFAEIARLKSADVLTNEPNAHHHMASASTEHVPRSQPHHHQTPDLIENMSQLSTSKSTSNKMRRMVMQQQQQQQPGGKMIYGPHHRPQQNPYASMTYRTVGNGSNHYNSDGSNNDYGTVLCNHSNQQNITIPPQQPPPVPTSSSSSSSSSESSRATFHGQQKSQISNIHHQTRLR